MKRKTTKPRLPQGVSSHFHEKRQAVEYTVDVYLYDPQTGRNTNRVRQGGFSTLEDAKTYVALLRRESQQLQFGLVVEKKPGVSLAAALEAYAADQTGGDARVYARRVFKAWLALLPPGVEVAQITTPDIRKHLTKRLEDGVAPVTADRELKIIAAALHKAPEFFAALKDWRAPRIPHPKYKKRRREIVITDEQYAALIDWLFEPQRPGEHPQMVPARARAGRFLQFMMLTGTRTGEAAAVKKSDIEWEYERVKIEGTKTDKTRYVPLSEPLADVLRDQLASAKDKGVYVWTRGGQMRPRIYSQIRAACEALGIPYGRGKGLDLYASRHTFTTKLMHAGYDLKTIGSITGQSDATMTLNYAHVSPGAQRNIAATISQIEAKRRPSPDHLRRDLGASDSQPAQISENKAED